MSKLEPRIKRLEGSTGSGKGETFKLGYHRILLGGLGRQVEREFFIHPEPPPLPPTMPLKITADEKAAQTWQPRWTSYRDETVNINVSVFEKLLQAVNGKTRSV